MNSSAQKYGLLIFLHALSLKKLILQSFLDLADCNQLQDGWPGFKSISMMQQLAKYVLDSPTRRWWGGRGHIMDFIITFIKVVKILLG